MIMKSLLIVRRMKMSKLKFLYHDPKIGFKEKADKEDFLSLKYPHTPRIELFLLAMALGKGVESELEQKESLVRGEYIKNHSDALALIVALSLGQKDDKTMENEALDSNYMFNTAEKTANTGFRILNSWIDELPQENLELKLIQKLDKVYKQNVSPYLENKEE